MKILGGGGGATCHGLTSHRVVKGRVILVVISCTKNKSVGSDKKLDFPTLGQDI